MHLKFSKTTEKDILDIDPLALWLQLLTHMRNTDNKDFGELLNPSFLTAHDDELGTLLHYAAAYNNSNIARYLINKCEMNVNALNCKSETPLMLAVENNCKLTVEVLLQSNANTDITDSHGMTAPQRFFASQKILDQGIFEAFARDFYINTSMDYFLDKLFNAGCTMYYAAYFSNKKYISGLFDRGVHIDSRGPNGETALHVAVSVNNLNLVKWLLDNKADVNALDNRGNGPLYIAASDGSIDILRLLLIAGANPHTKDFQDKSTPLYVAFRKSNLFWDGNLNECVKLLLQYAAIPQNPDESMQRIFHLALEKPKSKRTNYLISYLAILEGLGSPIRKSVMCDYEEEHRVAFDMVERFYEQCRKILQFKCAGTITLLHVLTVDKCKMPSIVRNEILVDTLKSIIPELSKTYPFYFDTLTKRMMKALDVVELEDAAIQVLCEMLFNGQYNLCYVVARKIVGFLDEHELKQLCQVFEMNDSWMGLSRFTYIKKASTLMKTLGDSLKNFGLSDRNDSTKS